MKTILPEGTAQVGCVTLAVVGATGAVGTAFIVTVLAAVAEQVVSAVFLTIKVYVPGANPENVALAWYVVPPLTLYSTPACVLKTIVPDGTAQVGCVTLDVVGTAGVPAATLIVTVLAAAVEQELSVVLLATNV